MNRLLRDVVLLVFVLVLTGMCVSAQTSCNEERMRCRSASEFGEECDSGMK